MKRRWIWIVGGLVGLSLALVGCAANMLPAVVLDPSMGPTPAALLGPFGDDPPVESLADWEARRAPRLRAAFGRDVYGPYPEGAAPARVLSRDAIAYEPLAAQAEIEQWSVAVGQADRPAHFNMVVVRPRDVQAPVPVIVMENFCGNRAAFRNPPDAIAGPLTRVLWVCDVEWLAPLIEAPLGRHISVPPYEDILRRGYAIAMFYAGDVVADDAQQAPAGLAQLYGQAAADAGAIAVWAWLYSQAYDVLAADSRFDPRRIAIWGHSRNGKAALYAGANDTRIAAIIAHQSGRGGASLRMSNRGESVGEMMEAYPWWFPAAYGRGTPEGLDQHALLALIAPRPVLLGNGARDAWSDPNSAWQAARAASAVYDLYGVPGLGQTEMRSPVANARLGYFIRPGLHGINGEDWRTFLDFLDAHLTAD